MYWKKIKKWLFAFFCLTPSLVFPVTDPVYGVILPYIGLKLDDYLAGIIPNYDWHFPKEDLNHKKEGYEFNNLIVLGDSLSDPGSIGRLSRYIAGGYLSPLYAEYLSDALTGKTLAPAQQGGLNYGLRGATMEAHLEHQRRSISEQYQSFLQRQKDKLDPSSPVILWGGNMDLNVSMVSHAFAILSGCYNLNSPDYSLGKSPKITADIAQDLINRGTPYVFVANIPDGTLFPYSMLVITETLANLIPTLTRPLPLPYTWIIEAAGAAADRYLRNSHHVIEVEGRNFYRLNHIHAMHKTLYGFLPLSLVAFLYDTITTLQSQIIGQYNYSLNKALKKVKGNIVYFDFAALLEELALYPKDYGLATTLVAHCTLGYSSRSCDFNSPYYHPESSLFSDWFHPSPEAHHMMAQNILAIFNAPLYISAIARDFSHLNEVRSFYLQGLITTFPRGKIKPHLFAAVSNGNDQDTLWINSKSHSVNLLHFGVIQSINRHWTLGAALSLASEKVHPHTLLHYHVRYQAVSLLAQYQSEGPFYFNGNIALSHLDTRSIKRSVLIGPRLLNLSGQTEALGIAALLRAGLQAPFRAHEERGVFVQIDAAHYDVHGFDEQGKKFLAMHYSPYVYTKENLSLGLNYLYRSDRLPLNFQLETLLKRPLGKRSFAISSHLKDVPISFKRQILPKEHVSFAINSHLNWYLNRHQSLTLDLGIESDSTHPHYRYALSWRSPSN